MFYQQASPQNNQNAESETPAVEQQAIQPQAEKELAPEEELKVIIDKEYLDEVDAQRAEELADHAIESHLQKTNAEITDAEQRANSIAQRDGISTEAAQSIKQQEEQLRTEENQSAKITSEQIHSDGTIELQDSDLTEITEDEAVQIETQKDRSAKLKHAEKLMGELNEGEASSVIDEWVSEGRDDGVVAQKLRETGELDDENIVKAFHLAIAEGVSFRDFINMTTEGVLAEQVPGSAVHDDAETVSDESWDDVLAEAGKELDYNNREKIRQIDVEFSNLVSQRQGVMDKKLEGYEAKKQAIDEKLKKLSDQRADIAATIIPIPDAPPVKKVEQQRSQKVDYSTFVDEAVKQEIAAFENTVDVQQKIDSAMRKASKFARQVNQTNQHDPRYAEADKNLKSARGEIMLLTEKRNQLETYKSPDGAIPDSLDGLKHHELAALYQNIGELIDNSTDEDLNQKMRAKQNEIHEAMETLPNKVTGEDQTKTGSEPAGIDQKAPDPQVEAEPAKLNQTDIDSLKTSFQNTLAEWGDPYERGEDQEKLVWHELFQQAKENNDPKYQQLVADIDDQRDQWGKYEPGTEEYKMQTGQAMKKILDSHNN